MNYIVAFAICLVGTVLAALTESAHLHWLLISDGNVALHLFIAWYLGKGKVPGSINIKVMRGE